MGTKSPGIDWAMIQAAMSSVPLAVGAPTALVVVLATAYQASDPTKAAVVSLNLNSVAGLTLGGGTVNTADVVMGATAAVAGGTGTIIGRYRNTLTGALVIGLVVNSDSASQIQFVLPIGWFFAVRQTAGTVSITSAFDQSMLP